MKQFGTETLNAIDIGSLTFRIDCSHVDGAWETQPRTRCCCCDAVLPGPGLGNHTSSSEPTGQEGLTNGIVDLVGAGVGEVLSFEINGCPPRFPEAVGACQGGRAADPIAEFVVEGLPESRVAKCLTGPILQAGQCLH